MRPSGVQGRTGFEMYQHVAIAAGSSSAAAAAAAAAEVKNKTDH